MSLPSLLSRFYHKALHFLGMSDIDYVELYKPEVPRGPAQILTYCENLQMKYLAEGSARIKNFLVVEVQCMKSQDGFQHEYLSVKVRPTMGNPDDFFWLIFDRGRGEGVLDQSSSNPLPSGNNATPASIALQVANASEEQMASSSSPATPAKFRFEIVHQSSKALRIASTNAYEASFSTSRSAMNSVETFARAASKATSTTIQNIPIPDSSSSKKLHFIADDQVCFSESGKYNNKDVVLFTFKDFKDPTGVAMVGIPLFEFAVLAHVIHMRHAWYQLTSTNCYYFVEGIVYVLRGKYKAACEERSDMKVDTWFKVAMGRLNGYIPSASMDHSQAPAQFEDSLENTWMKPILEKEEQIALKEEATERELQEARQSMIVEKQRAQAENQRALAAEQRADAMSAELAAMQARFAQLQASRSSEASTSALG